MAKPMRARNKAGMTESEQAEADKLTRAKLAALLDGVTEKPQDYQSRTGDVDGFWPTENAGGLHFTPLYYNLSDSKLDAVKPSILVFGRLETGRKLLDQEGNVVDCTPGKLVAFWAKVGMKAIGNLADVPVWLEWTGEVRDTGKGNPMKVYDVSSKASGNKLPLGQDMRVKSKTTRHFFDSDSS